MILIVTMKQYKLNFSKKVNTFWLIRFLKGCLWDFSHVLLSYDKSANNLIFLKCITVKIFDIFFYFQIKVKTELVWPLEEVKYI